MQSDQPQWAQKIEDWGKDFEKKFESKFEKHKSKLKPWEKKSEFVWNIAFSLVWLYVINNIQAWLPGYFTESYPALLAVANPVIIIQIVIYVILFLVGLRWVYYLGKSAENVFGLISVVTAIVIFPFNIPFGLTYIVRFGLTIATVVMAIVGFVYLIKAFFAVLNPLK